MIQIKIASIKDINAAAKLLLEELGGQKKIAFIGEMGAGKTTFIQALCKVMGVEENVTSPTFALVNQYFTAERDSVFHFDLYRIESVTELYDIGYEDYFYSDSYCFIEWPEKALELIPPDFIFLSIQVLGDGSRELKEVSV